MFLLIYITVNIKTVLM